MPSRAFFVFQLRWLFDTRRGAVGSQCPHGHFLFFNTLEVGARLKITKRSQCPHGHFLFFNGLNQRFRPVGLSVSMPSRAFFVFQSYFIERMKVMFIWSLNALTGIFCFSMKHALGISGYGNLSQCPHGHFLFFNSFGKKPEINFIVVSMPSRAFFVFQLIHWQMILL